MFGGVVSVALTNVNVTLTAPAGSTTPGAGPYQSQNALIKFTGTLTGNVVITIPLPGYYIVRNNCSGTGSFYVQLSGGAGNKIGAPPGTHCHIFTDGTDVEYVNLAQVGSYLDLAVNATPTWMNACTVAPYLICDGTVYNIATYPMLGGLLGATFGGNGSTTFGVPDLRGRSRYYKDNQGGSAANRITAAGGNYDGTTLGNSGGAQNHTMVTAEMPSHTHSVTDSGHSHAGKSHRVNITGGSGALVMTDLSSSGTSIGSTETATTGISIATAGSGSAFTVLGPSLITGISYIKT